MKIGVLCIQGAFIEHIRFFKKLGAECIMLRKKSDITDMDGLVLPGGESTVQGKLLHELDMFDDLKRMIMDGLPVFATCAGLILLSEKLTNDSNVYFGTLPISTRRNAYGRQSGSFQKTLPFKNIDNFLMTFIRAPYIEKADKRVEILAKSDNEITAVRYQNQVGLSFHPELGNDMRIHKYFMDIVKDYSDNRKNTDCRVS